VLFPEEISMSCIAGVVENRIVYVGADSASTNDADQQTIRADTKVFRNGAFLFGCTTSFRMIQLLQYSLVLPDMPEPEKKGDEDPLFRYMATDFVNAVRTCLKEGGFAKKEDERESGGSFLVAWRGRLFCIGSDYQVEESLNGYNAVGSGDDLALGVLHVTSQLDLSPEQRLRHALEAAASHNSSVRPPFIIRCLSPEIEPAEVRS
jgi:hypothetical protein